MQHRLLQIDWQSLLLGEESWSFLAETAFRSVIMFLIILLCLRFLGKRGIKQLSVFELGVIIGLGSAAGDPMFYKDVGLLPGLVVFLVVISLYKLVTYFINRSNRFEQFVEGKPAYVVENGRLLYSNFRKEEIARDELYMQLRLKNVTHLGQVKTAIIEADGEVSVFYFTDEEVVYGLPILPHHKKHTLKEIAQEDFYACTHCGHTEKMESMEAALCTTCNHSKWIRALNEKRVT